LTRTAPGAVLVKYWRILFHARIHAALQERFQERRVLDAHIQDRVRRIGGVQFEEIRHVLRDDRYLLPPGDDRETYVEFAAVYLELSYFARPLLRQYFPSIAQFDDIDALLAEDVDAARLFAATRPEGAPDPQVLEDRLDEEPEAEAEPEQEAPAAGEPDFNRFCQLIRRAKRAAKRGNTVRAAVCRTRAAGLAPPERREETWAGARAELERLAGRLQPVLGLTKRDTDRWRRALTPLLEPAARGIWPAEARLLYDLQKVCVDHERELYSVDILAWVAGLGRRPLKRPLPREREVLLLKRLRSARRRVRSVRLGPRDRERLSGLLRDAVHGQEQALRDRFGPLIRETLEGVGMRPRNTPERVALDKLVEELLDRVSERGFLTMGDLRDAISRNNLKLPDVAGPAQFLAGDWLLRADRRLAEVLDGVYRGGEAYLRGLQRLSSVAFGTRRGRFLTRYAVLPFGGAWVVLEGFQHLIGHVFRKVSGTRLHLVTPLSVILLGVFLLGLLYSDRFRRLVLWPLRQAYRGARILFVDVPAFVLALPAVRRVLDSGPVVFVRRYVLKPFLAAAVSGLALRACGVSGGETDAVGGAVFLAAAVLLNTRLGRNLEEAATDWLARTWHHLHFNLLPGVYRFVMEMFKQLVEDVDRMLYRVDEWLRFRRGDSRTMLVAKAGLGVIWFGVTYVVRFCTIVLIEPQINPIKHFPVVTVSHKLILTLFCPPFARLLSLTMDPALAVTVAFTVGAMIPGFFGFLVWELKENWRLYRANQPATLRPVAIGHHGETMPRLLRPGFHSGTVPSLYARLRRAGRAAYRTGEWSAARRHAEGLHHVGESVRHFVDRELVCLLKRGRAWGQTPLAIGAVRLGTNRIAVELCRPDMEPAGVELAFEEEAGRLTARFPGSDWLVSLSPDQRQTLEAALVGLYQMAGVDRVRVVAERPSAEAPTGNGTSVTPGDSAALPTTPVAWQEWIEIWEHDRQGKM
jgi:hypothetical protein